MSNRSAYTSALRAIADFLDDHPELPLPETTISCFTTGNTVTNTEQIARELGSFSKDYGDNLLYLLKPFPPITLRYVIWREAICTRVQTGTKIVTKLSYPPNVKPTETQVEEPIYEWKCPPLLGGDHANEQLPSAADDLDDEIPF